MKDIKELLIEENQLFIQKKKDITTILTSLIHMNFCTHGRYEKTFILISEHLQEIVQLIDHVIIDNNEMINDEENIQIQLKDGTILDFNNTISKKKEN